MISVIVPCYRVKNQIVEVLRKIGPEVHQIICVDDGCPESSGQWIQSQCISDRRIKVLFHSKNQGVGAALCTGFREALKMGATICVKLDGDGQMDPAQIPRLIAPILAGRADYTKGNRFHRIRYLRGMPLRRLIGNAGLSWINKWVSGYWNVMDPTNGFIAIHRSVLAEVPLDEIARDYFFESDMLFQMGQLRAVVRDVPIPAQYSDETSSLRIIRVLLGFPPRYLIRLGRRLVYQYFLRDFNLGSVLFILGAALLVSGSVFGIYEWNRSIATGTPATSGTVMLAALQVILGFQCLLGMLLYDLSQVPREPIQNDFETAKR